MAWILSNYSMPPLQPPNRRCAKSCQQPQAVSELRFASEDVDVATILIDAGRRPGSEMIPRPRFLLGCAARPAPLPSLHAMRSPAKNSSIGDALCWWGRPRGADDRGPP